MKWAESRRFSACNSAHLFWNCTLMILRVPSPTTTNPCTHAAGGRPALVPPGANPHALAALLKHFLIGLPEPLLTYRLLPDFISTAGELK